MSSNQDWVPHIVVATVVEQRGKYLIVEERINGELRLNQPAGHWEQGETLQQAAIRETLEESGWDVAIENFLGVYEWHPPGLAYPFVRFAFAGKALRHYPQQALDEGIERALWLSLDELKARSAFHRGPAVLQCIEDYRAGRFHSMRAIQHLQDWTES